MNIVLGIVFGTIYFDVPNTNTGISDRNFFILQFAIVVGMFTCLLHACNALFLFQVCDERLFNLEA